MAIVKEGPANLILCDVSSSGGTFTATCKWRLKVQISNDPLDMLSDRVASAFAGELPVEGTTYPDRPLATCRSVDCKRDGANGVFVFTAKFSDENADSESEEAGTDENPLLDRPIIKPTAGIQPLAIHRDRDDNAILNKAGDPIIQQRDDNTIGFSVQANVANIPWWILYYRNGTNDAPFVIDGLEVAKNMARFVLPSDWKSEYKNRNDIQFVVFKYELLIDERDLHYGVPLNAGFREKVPRYILDSNGEATTEQARRPVMTVDGNGDPIQETDENGDPVWGDLLWDRKTITENDGSEVQEAQPLDNVGFKLDDPTPETSTFLEVKKYYERNFLILPGLEPVT